MPTIDNWRALREALEAGPTGGPWTLELVEDRSIKHLCPVDADGLSILTVVTHDETPFAAVYLDKDAAYIAAANPATIRALLAERDRLAAEVEALRADAAKRERCAMSDEWLVKVRRLVQGFEHVSGIARLWEPDYSTGSERALWARATEACADVAKLLNGSTDAAMKGTP